MHLEHVNLSVTDLERSIDLYGGLLGLAVRWRGTTRQGWPAAHIGDEHQYLALFQPPDARPIDPKSYDAVGLNHMGFVVDDLDAAIAHLRARGLAPVDPIDTPPGRRVYVIDPDGIEIELVEYAPTDVVAPMFPRAT